MDFHAQRQTTVHAKLKRAELGWAPTVGFEALIHEMVDADRAALRREHRLLRDRMIERLGTFMVGESQAIREVQRLIEAVAPSDMTVLVHGESGVGKELVAHALHESSARAGRPFVAVDCCTLQETLFESELFGHEKGAFTGADQRKQGLIETAEGGTLFLDEVGELSAAVQAKLLRFLQSGEVQGVGEARPRRVDVRVIAATHRDLMAEARANRFREDLFYRLSVVPIELPPLRAREGDVMRLIEHYLDHFAHRHGRPAPALAREAVRALEDYAWPGNVRELRNLCERLVILHGGATVAATDLPLRHGAGATAADAGTDGAPAIALPAGGLDWGQLERSLIGQALEQAGGNQSRAARLLGMSRDRFLYRLKRLGGKA